MTSGRRVGYSKIDQNNLRDPILELKRIGLSYSDIIHQIRSNYNVTLNKSNLTSFFARGENQINLMSDSNSNQDGLAQLHMNLKTQLIDIRKNLKSDMELLMISIDESNLKPIERSNLKKSIKVYEKRLFKELDHADNSILNVVGTLHQSTKAMTQFLIDMSNELCPSCARVVAYYATKIEKAEGS